MKLEPITVDEIKRAVDRHDRLWRVPQEPCFRLMVVDFEDCILTGQTSGANTLMTDIELYTTPVCKPLYSVFVRPH